MPGMVDLKTVLRHGICDSEKHILSRVMSEEEGPEIPSELLDAIGWSSDEDCGPVSRRCPPKVGHFQTDRPDRDETEEVWLDAATCATMYRAACALQ